MANTRHHRGNSCVSFAFFSVPDPAFRRISSRLAAPRRTGARAHGTLAHFNSTPHCRLIHTPLYRDSRARGSHPFILNPGLSYVSAPGWSLHAPHPAKGHN